MDIFGDGNKNDNSVISSLITPCWDHQRAIKRNISHVVNFMNFTNAWTILCTKTKRFRIQGAPWAASLLINTFALMWHLSHPCRQQVRPSCCMTAVYIATSHKVCAVCANFNYVTKSDETEKFKLFLEKTNSSYYSICIFFALFISYFIIYCSKFYTLHFRLSGLHSRSVTIYQSISRPTAHQVYDESVRQLTYRWPHLIHDCHVHTYVHIYVHIRYMQQHTYVFEFLHDFTFASNELFNSFQLKFIEIDPLRLSIKLKGKSR